MLPRSPAPRRRTGAAEGDARRFSPLNAPQRAAVDAFCRESRKWALTQAERTYRHLPVELREQAVDAAMHELRTGAPPAVDRRTLHAELAKELTEALRRIHVGWCLNQAGALWEDQAAPAAPGDTPGRDPLTGFIEDGLGGLERAVLQLEIGAGRDSRTVRAALRLGPTQYARHREEGLSKLRDALTSRVLGKVCDHHVASVVRAATGDKIAANGLAGGSARCRSCAREAQGLRRVLHQSLALAPWPLVIKPAGLVAAKLGALGAVFGKGASGAGAGAGAAAGGSSVGTGAGALTAVLAAAAVATGGVAAVDKLESPAAAPPAKVAAATPAPAPAATPAAPARKAATPAAAATGKSSTTRAQRRARDARAGTRRAAGAPKATAPAAAPVATQAPAATPAPAAAAPALPSVKDTVNTTVDGVRDTVKKVTEPLAPQLAQPVDDTLAGVQQTVEGVTGLVDGVVGGLLKPQP